MENLEIYESLLVYNKSNMNSDVRTESQPKKECSDWNYDYSRQYVVFGWMHERVVKTKERYARYIRELEGKHDLLMCAECGEYYRSQDLIGKACLECATEE
jgi:hypothetical protein